MYMEQCRKTLGTIVRVRVVPNAKHTSLDISEDGDLQVRVTQPPSNGRANTQVIQVLATAFHVPKSSITLLTGSTARAKRLLVDHPFPLPPLSLKPPP